MNWLDTFAGLKQSKDTSIPMYQQIINVVKQSIQSRQLADNSRLPTNRDLAAFLKIDRSTVSRAYFELQKEGLIESHVGRGTIVTADATKRRASEFDASAGMMLWSEKFSKASDSIVGIFNRYAPSKQLSADTIVLASGVPTSEFYPYDDFRRIVADLFKSNRTAEMFNYSPAHGNASLCLEVRKFLKGQSIDVSDEELLMVSGSQQGIDLVSKTFVEPDDVVLIEEPTYTIALATFKASQARFLPIPVDEDGLKVDVLESIISRQRAKLLYVMPNFQNPTGSTMPMARRQRLFEIARKHQLPILEDNYVGELHYDGVPPLSLKALDKEATVVMHQGTFSKSLCPGLRLGYLTAPQEVMTRLLYAKRACDLSTNSQAQVIMAEYLKRDLYQVHLDQVRAAYRRRREAMCKALERHVDKSITWSRPKGGMFLWAKLPSGFSARELLAYAEKEGVVFYPGDNFSLSGEHPEYFRLSFIQSSEDQIEEGIARLAKAVKSYFASRQQMKEMSYGRQDWRAEATLM
jgi:DNA-binding transcriptional MocR family regulator